MKYVLSKITNLIISLFFISIVVFFSFHTLKGDTASIILGPEADYKQIENLKQSFNLNENIFIRYLDWVFKVLKGDLGKSIRFNEDVKNMIEKKLPITLFLTFLTLCLIIVISSLLSFIIIKYNNTFICKIILAISQIMISIPNFLLGIIISSIFGITFSIFPVCANSLELEGNLTDILNLFLYLFLPALSLALGNAALIIKFLKNFVEEQLQKDYVKTLISRGLSKNSILFKHILKNCLLHIITILALMITDIIGGSIIIENIFSISGIGSLITTAVFTRDFILLQGLVLYVSFFIIIINFTIDFLYKLIDPRIKIK